MASGTSSAPISHDVFLVEMDAKTKALEEYRTRCELLRKQNETLKKELQQQQYDGGQVEKLLEGRAADAEGRVEQLQKQVACAHEGSTQKEREMREEFEASLRDLEHRYDVRDREQTETIRELQDELARVIDFRGHKQQLEQELDALKRELRDERRRHMMSLQELNSRFLEEKTRVRMERDKQLQAIKDRSIEDAFNRLDAQTRRLWERRAQVEEQLRFGAIEREELQRMRQDLEEQFKEIQRQNGVNVDLVQEQAKKGVHREREIHTLKNRIKHLELHLSETIRKHEEEKVEQERTMERELYEAQQDAQSLQVHLDLKDKEMRRIRALAKVILEQRDCVEEFLLDAIRDVRKKETTGEQHDRIASSRSSQIASGGRSQGSSKSTQRTVQGPSLPSDFSEMSWEEKEKIIQMLLLRVNRTQMPSTENRASGALPWRHERAPLRPTLPLSLPAAQSRRANV